jgi:hypothetical protein
VIQEIFGVNGHIRRQVREARLHGRGAGGVRSRREGRGARL